MKTPRKGMFHENTKKVYYSKSKGHLGTITLLPSNLSHLTPSLIFRHPLYIFKNTVFGISIESPFFSGVPIKKTEKSNGISP